MMGTFWFIPAFLPLAGALLILVLPCWPICRAQGATSDQQIQQNWVRFGVYLAVNLLACLVFSLVAWQGAVSKQYFSEVWDQQVTTIRWEQPWTTKDYHTRQVPCGHHTEYTGSGKNRRSHTVTDYRTEVYYTTGHHGPYWYATDEYGAERRIDQPTYNAWRQRWGSEHQTGIHRGDSAGWFEHSVDGPILSCAWPGTLLTIWPEPTVHQYVNKIRVSNSVLNYGTPTPAEVTLWSRPVDSGNLGPVQIYGQSLKLTADQLLYLGQVNACLGRRYEVHPILCCFGPKVDRSVVEPIMRAWQGPNKNELLTFCSLDGSTVRWVEVRSWLDNTTLHATLRDQLIAGPFSPERYAELLLTSVPTLWHRKHFTPLNQYLQVRVSPGWLWLALGGSLLCGIISFIVISLTIKEDTKPRDYDFSRPYYRDQ